MRIIKRIRLLIILLFAIATSVQAQNAPTNQADTSQKRIQEVSDTDLFTNHEIEIMDSLLNLWYIRNELTHKNSILSKLTDDTTRFEDNDSLIFDRLSKIVTVVPLAFNAKVKRYIELYAVQRQRSSSVILGLAQYYYPWMKAIFDQYDVPEELVYITIIESALNPTAVSPAGATGIWQFMYGTGKLYGLEVDTYVDDRRDPYKATDAAARHFRDLYNIFNDWGLAISAYNCGAGNVRKAIQRSGGKTDFWGVSSYLPKETQNYFPAYIGALYMMTYHNLYNITPTPLTFATNVDTVMVNKELHLEQVATVLEIPLDELTSLNPQYKRQIIPAFNGKQYPLRLPANEAIRFIDLKDSIQNYHYDDYFNATKNHIASTKTTTKIEGDKIVETTPNKYHYVKKNETLSKIASKYGLSVTQLKSMNHLHSSTIRVGQKLLVQKGKTTTRPNPAAMKDSTVVVADSTNLITSSDSTILKQDTTLVQTTVPQDDIVHTVKKGETLSAIAKRYGKTATEIANYNKLSNMNSLQIGQKLKISR